MTAAKFCKLCLEVFDEVHETGRPYIITEKGKGVIKVVPLDDWEPPKKEHRTKKRQPKSKTHARKDVLAPTSRSAATSTRRSL